VVEIVTKVIPFARPVQMAGREPRTGARVHRDDGRAKAKGGVSREGVNPRQRHGYLYYVRVSDKSRRVKEKRGRRCKRK